jgi:hypothetical protein
MPKVRCLIMMTAAMAVIAVLSGDAMAANQQIGGGGLGFSCDVNTQRCECSGVETGADCQGMKKNCAATGPTASRQLNLLRERPIAFARWVVT